MLHSFSGHISFILQIFSSEHRLVSPALTPLWFTEAKYEISFFFDRTCLDWQLNKWEIIYCEESSRLLLAELLPVSEACVCVCVCVCFQMALKVDLMLGLRHHEHNSVAVSRKNSVHHFIPCKNLCLLVVLFLHIFMEDQTNGADFNVPYLWVEHNETFKGKFIPSLVFPVSG